MGAVTFSPTAEIAALACLPRQEDFFQLLWDPSSGALNRLTGAPDTQYRQLAFSPDGRLIAAGSEAGIVSLWHGVSGEHLYTLPYTFRDLEDLHFIFQGRLLALLKPNGSLMVFGLK
jgi:WD40 repeat protein